MTNKDKDIESAQRLSDSAERENQAKEKTEDAMTEEEEEQEAAGGEAKGRGEREPEERTESEADAVVTTRSDSVVETETNDGSKKRESESDGSECDSSWGEGEGEGEEEGHSAAGRVRRKRRRKGEEEDKSVVWIKKIDDTPTYLKVMRPRYLFLEVRTASRLEEQQVRLALSHLPRVWPWWGLEVRLRGDERLPWVCLAPALHPTLQVSGDDDDDFDEDESWDMMERQQWQHKNGPHGNLCQVTLLRHSLSPPPPPTPPTPAPPTPEVAVEGGVAQADRDENKSTSDSGVRVACTTNTPSAKTLNDTGFFSVTASKDLPDFPHKANLVVGIPRPFLDAISTDAVCAAIITLLDDVVAGRITETFHLVPEVPASSEDQANEDQANKPQIESHNLGLWLEERLKEASSKMEKERVSNSDLVSGGHQGEDNEDTNHGYVKRDVDHLTSRNFINKCKAERVSYVNGFTTCVSAAAAAFLTAGATGEGRPVVTRHRVTEHHPWPSEPYQWQDSDPEAEPPPPPRTNWPGVVITAPLGKGNSSFWDTARQVNQQRLEAPTGGRKGNTLQIVHALENEEDEEEWRPQRHPDVNLRLCGLKTDEAQSPKMLVVGTVAGLGPHAFTPLRHFLLTHSIELKVKEDSEVLSFSLHHTTLFLHGSAGHRFADEIVTAIKDSLKSR